MLFREFDFGYKRKVSCGYLSQRLDWSGPKRQEFDVGSDGAVKATHREESVYEFD